MASSRMHARALIAALAPLRWGVARSRPRDPARILVLHHLLLGDTLMLTPLVAKLRALWPAAAITMTVASAYEPLYAGRPYGIVAHPFDPRDPATLRALLAQPRFDLALLPADNRWSWAARALGVRWIVGFAGDRPGRKNWPVDELRPYADAPQAYGDTVATLVDGPSPRPYVPGDWPAPPGAPPVAGPYALLHVGASTPLKRWPAARWRELAQWLEGRGLPVVWSAGPGEEALVEDVGGREPRFAGTLALDALWHLAAGADLLVCPDTGIAHLGRVVGTPTVALFGPGSAVACGAGAFWSTSAYRAVTVDPFPCRDQATQFARTVSWMRRCDRRLGEPPEACARARCMEAISVTAVTDAIASLRLEALLAAESA